MTKVYWIVKGTGSGRGGNGHYVHPPLSFFAAFMGLALGGEERHKVYFRANDVVTTDQKEDFSGIDIIKGAQSRRLELF